MSEFVAKAGDVVRLRSGGLPMTVERRVDPSVDPPSAHQADVLAIWMSLDGQMNARWLPDCVLEKADA